MSTILINIFMCFAVPILFYLFAMLAGFAFTRGRLMVEDKHQEAKSKRIKVFLDEMIDHLESDKEKDEPQSQKVE